jgi:hypothetical protein
MWLILSLLCIAHAQTIVWNSYQGLVGAPQGLTGHSLTSIGGGQFLQFGGHVEQWDLEGDTSVNFTNTLYLLSLKEGWTQVQTNEGPSPRANHQAVYDYNNNQLLIFGGMIFNDYINVTLLNDFWSFDLGNAVWNRLDDLPEGVGLSGASVTFANGLLVIFGGMTTSLFGFPIYTNNTFIYDTDNGKYIQIEKNIMPLARGYAQSFLMNGGLYVSGGQASSTDGFIIGNPSDTWRLDLSTYDWDDITDSENSVVPSRQGSAVMPINDMFVVVYGGQMETDSNCGFPFSIAALDDSWTFDMFNYGWYIFDIKGSQPMPLFSAASACDQNLQQCVITGGINFICGVDAQPIHNEYLYILSTGS